MKFIYTLLISFLLSVPVFAQTLVGSWQFNGNANDASGNNLNGTVYNATLTAGQAGIPNTAYQFNGINSHIDVGPYTPLLDLPTWTIQTTVRIDGFNSNTCQQENVVARGTSYGFDSYGVALNDNTYDNSCALYSPNNTEFVSGAAGSPTTNWHNGNYIQLNTWYCLTVTYDGSKLIEYRNGIAMDSVNWPNQYNYGTTQPLLSFGYYPLGGISFPYWLNGAIDNVTIWSGVMSTAATVSLAQHHDTICAGNHITLTATGSGAYSWSPTTGLSTLTGPSVIASPTTTTTYYVTSTGLGCNTAIDSVTVVVLPSGPTTIVASSPNCAGSPISLSTAAITGGSYYWTGPGGFASNVQSPVILNATTVNSGTYFLQTTQPNGCSSAVITTVIVVNAIPPAPIASNITYCQFDNATTLAATGIPGGTLQWYTVATGGIPVASVVPSTATAGTTIYYVSQVVNGCEGQRTPLVVTIKAKPPLPTGAGSYIFCQYDVVPNLNVTGQGLQWFTISIGGIGSATTPTLSSSTVDTMTYYVSETVNGCASDRMPITVIVKAKPQPPHVTDTNYCRGSATLTLKASGQGITWYTSDTIQTGTIVSPVLSSASAIGSFTYYVSQKINGCESNRAALRVEIDNMPVVGVMAAAKSPLCQYDTISFSDSSIIIPGYNYLWSLPTGSTLLNGSLTNGAPITVILHNSGTYQEELIVTNKKCVATASYNVLVTPSPEGNLDVKKTVCVDEQVIVELTGKKNVTSFTVDLGGGSLLSVDSTSDIYYAMWHNAGVYTITVNLSPSGATGCGYGLFEDTITVYPLPDVHIEPLNGSLICDGDNVVMNAVDPAITNVYEWAPLGVFYSRDKGTSAVAIIDSSVYIYLQATSSYGCVNTDSVYIAAKSCCGLYFPNAFTPNEDGKNDIFRPITQGNHKVSIFSIENRYGQVVFTTIDERKGWDGKLDGVEQPIGTYFFLIKYQCSDGKDYLKKGDFELIR